MKPRRAVVLGTLLFLAVCAWEIIPMSAASVESAYGAQIYPLWTRILVPLTDFVVVPIGLVALGLGLPATLVFLLVRGRRDRARGADWRRLLLATAGRVFILVLSVYLVFIACWGACYRRPPLEERMGIDDRTLDSAELVDLADRVVKIVVRDYPEVDERDFSLATAAMRDSLRTLIEEWRLGEVRLPHSAKRVPAGWLLTFGSAGLCFPFTLEAYVDGGLPDVAFLAVALHELAHVGGMARESDADLAAYVAGLRSQNPYVRYALSLRLLRSVSRELEPDDRDRIRNTLPDGVRQDLRDIRDAMRRYDSPTLRAAQRRVYDQYLRSQGVDDGLRNYSKGLRLVVGAIENGLVELPR